MEKNISSSQKYYHFFKKTAQILHKIKSLILAPFYYAKFAQFLCKNGNIFGCYKLFFTSSLGHELHGKTIKFVKTNYVDSFCLFGKKGKNGNKLNFAIF